ncbi:MAG: hypothetical protein WEB02_05765 [Methylophaga sp.]
MIIRTKRYEKYTVLSDELIENKNLDWDALGLLAYLLSKKDNWQVMPKVLAKQRKSGEHTIRRMLKDLRDAGYVELKKLKGGHVNWLVYDIPQVIDNKPDHDFSNLQNSLIEESSNSENHHAILNKDLQQLNIEFIYFWESYPVKKNRVAAEREWQTLGDGDKQNAVENIERFVSSLPRWQTIPYPYTYLNQRRWLDDLTPTAKPTQSQKTHLPRHDEQLTSWAAKNGLPEPIRGENFPQYRARLTNLIELRNNQINGK